MEQFVKLGGEIVAEERYGSDVTDFRSQLTKIVNANPDAIHVSAQAEFSGGTVVKQIRELGYEGRIYSEIVPVGATALEVAGEAATWGEGHHCRTEPGQRKKPGGAVKLQGAVRLRNSALVPGLRLRRRVHHG